VALNKAVFKTRSLTALIFVAVMLIGLLWNFWSFAALFLIIHFGCWYEFVKLLKKIQGPRYLNYVWVGVFYISLSIGLLLLIRYSGITWKGNQIYTDFGYIIPCGIIFSIWINDTMAYLVGSFIGKTPFSKISPKKTWEGTAGGAILCVAVITLLGYYVTGRPVRWAIISAICAIFGTAGDLLESKIKRLADVKDSGSFMPGHGGFLDRFDSLLVATPVVALYLWLAGA
jgi:phosphatidate cytidylyltransferase